MLNKGEYNKDVEYFMLSANKVNPPGWIRNPFMTKKQLSGWFLKILMQDEEYRDIELFSESTLDEVVFTKDQSGELVEITLREYLFGERYQSYSRRIRE